MAETKALSERAKYRLRLAAATLRSRGQKLNFPREEFYERIQEIIASLSAEEQASLKGIVDWTEDYDRAEAKYFGQAARSTKGS